MSDLIGKLESIGQDASLRYEQNIEDYREELKTLAQNDMKAVFVTPGEMKAVFVAPEM